MASIKKTGLELDYKFDDKLRILLENIMRHQLSSGTVKRHVKRGNRKILYDRMKNYMGGGCHRIYQQKTFLKFVTHKKFTDNITY